MSISAQLLAWYDRNHRDLPWRISPAARARGAVAEPYRVWLSEIMLQQTTVQAVRPYFGAFLQKWPRLEDLAAADIDEIMKAWAGLGYYSRARNLKACADMVLERHGGQFPDTEAGLRALPGIGPYTAAAIAAIAFDRPAAVVDGNIERVFARLHELETPLPAAKTTIRALVGVTTPAKRPGDFAQALMDLGAIICTPANPACSLCPVSQHCGAYASGRQSDFPVKAARKARPVRRGAAFVAVNPDNAVHLVKRPASGLLGGMSGVPTSGWTSRADGETGIGAAPYPAEWRRSGTISHVFTHFELRLEVYRASVTEPAGFTGWWSAADSLADEALPSVMKKAIAAALPDAFPTFGPRTTNQRT